MLGRQISWPGGESVEFPGFTLLCSPPPEAGLRPTGLPSFPGVPPPFRVNETEGRPLQGFVSSGSSLGTQALYFLSVVAITGVLCSQFTVLSGSHCAESQEAR